MANDFSHLIQIGFLALGDKIVQAMTKVLEHDLIKNIIYHKLAISEIRPEAYSRHEWIKLETSRGSLNEAKQKQLADWIQNLDQLFILIDIEDDALLRFHNDNFGRFVDRRLIFSIPLIRSGHWAKFEFQPSWVRCLQPTHSQLEIQINQSIFSGSLALGKQGSDLMLSMHSIVLTVYSLIAPLFNTGLLGTDFSDFILTLHCGYPVIALKAIGQGSDRAKTAANQMLTQLPGFIDAVNGLNIIIHSSSQILLSEFDEIAYALHTELPEYIDYHFGLSINEFFRDSLIIVILATHCGTAVARNTAQENKKAYADIPHFLLLPK